MWKFQNHIPQSRKIWKLLVELPLEDDKFASLQKNDLKIRNLMTRWKKENINNFILSKIMYSFRSIVDNGHRFEARVIPESLRDVVLLLGHNQSGHNGYQKKHTLLSSVCTNGRVWGHKSYNIAKAVRYVQYKRLKKNTVWKTNIWTRHTANGIHKYGLNWRIPPPFIKR